MRAGGEFETHQPDGASGYPIENRTVQADKALFAGGLGGIPTQAGPQVDLKINLKPVLVRSLFKPLSGPRTPVSTDHRLHGRNHGLDRATKSIHHLVTRGR